MKASCNSWHLLYLTVKRKKKRDERKREEKNLLLIMVKFFLSPNFPFYCFTCTSFIFFFFLLTHHFPSSHLISRGQLIRALYRNRETDWSSWIWGKNKGQLGVNSWVQSVIIFVIFLILMSCHLTHAKAGPQASTDRSIGYNVHFFSLFLFFLRSMCKTTSKWQVPSAGYNEKKTTLDQTGHKVATVIYCITLKVNWLSSERREKE